MTQRIVLAGGSGFLGSSLAARLAHQGFDVVTLTRSPRDACHHGRDVYWDGRTTGAWIEACDGAQAVINLTGRSVDCRYTAANRREIVDSRVESVRAIGAALARASDPPPVWIQASSLAIYGDAGDRICTEDAPAGEGFSVDVCRRWEDAFHEQQIANVRPVVLRIGFVLARGDGALRRLERITRCFAGGTVGTGRQYISWLHQDDLNRMVEWCLENPATAGIYNATGPQPVTNATFMRALRRSLRRPWSPPTPMLAVRIGARLMQIEASLALTGRRCVPRRFEEEGFSFRYTDLETCLDEIYHPGAVALIESGVG